MNLFRGNFDYRRVAALTQHILEMLSRSAPQYKFDETHEATLSAAIRKAALRKQPQRSVAVLDGRVLKAYDVHDVELSVEDLVDALPPSARAWRLGCQLMDLVPRPLVA